MNQNLSRQKLVIGGVAAVAALLAVITFMGQRKQENAAPPETVVDVVYKHCQAQEYAQAGAYFESGPRTDAGLRVSVCEKITQARTVTSHKTYLKNEAVGEIVILESQNQLAMEPGRHLTWTMVFKRGRWLVREVV